MELSDKPVLNNEFTEWATGLVSKVKSAASSAKESAAGSGYAWVVVIGLIALVIGAFIWYFVARSKFETPSNISRIGNAALKAQSDYDKNVTSRIGIRQYLLDLKNKGIPDTHLCLTNFYVCSVNFAGIFSPGVDAIVSPAAIKTAYDAGVRAFVFDIWPDLTPGANFAPVLQIVESGSLWRRISLNAIPLSSCLQALSQIATAGPGNEDPLLLYLRFRGNPRTTTYTATAQALIGTFEQKRLDPIFNNCRGQDDLFKTPMTSLLRKVIIVSNTRANGNMLSDLINIGPKDGIKLEWGINEAKGLGVDAKADAIRKVQQNICFVAPLSETPDASNNYDTSAAASIGVHCCAMNLWNRNDNLKAYMGQFPEAGYSLKPEALRYIIEVLPPPKYPQDPKWGSGTTAGTPTTPPAIRLP